MAIQNSEDVLLDGIYVNSTSNNTVGSFPVELANYMTFLGSCEEYRWRRHLLLQQDNL